VPREGQAQLAALVPQKLGFRFYAAREPRQVSSRSNNSMARNDDRERVTAVCGADSARGCGAAQLAGLLTVGDGLAVGNRPQDPPGRLLKLGATRIQRQVEGSAATREVLTELSCGRFENRMISRFDVKGRRWFSARPENRREALIADHQHEFADWRADCGRAQVVHPSPRLSVMAQRVAFPAFTVGGRKRGHGAHVRCHRLA
jgi:hypothetical protein